MKIHSSLVLGALVTAFSLAPQSAKADLAADIAAACSAGGSVVLPATLTVTSTIGLKCAPTTPERLVTLKGAPTTITCQTGGAPCIEMGSAITGTYRHNLSMEGIFLVGPGRTTVGSEGIRVLASAYESNLNNIRIEGFDRGMHFIGTDTGITLLARSYLSHVSIGSGTGAGFPSTNIAVHLEGPVANVKFDQFNFAGWQRVIQIDGAGGSGAGATFSNGDLNLTKTPGTAAVYVNTTDNSGHMVNMFNIEDWETETPYLEVGNRSYVTISGIAFSGHPFSSGARPAFRMLPGVDASRLTISDSWLYADAAGASQLVSVESANAEIKISGSHIQGGMQFLAPAIGSIFGNQCDYPGATGQKANVRMAANTGSCPNQ